MAGLACAERLAGQGHDVDLFDKGRGPGGRMSTRRLVTPEGEAQFDHGAQYFTIHDDAFRRRVDSWISEGAAAPWPSAGTQAYVGVPAMNSPVRLMADGQSVHWNALVTRIEACRRGWRFMISEAESVDLDLAVVATPAEQAASLLSSIAPDLAARALSVPSDPCWTVMLAFSKPVPVAQNCWRGEGPVAWAARNNSKPGRLGPESWVVQASPDWSKAHIEADSKWVTETITGALSNLLGAVLPPLLGHSSHRWRFARSGIEGSRAIFDADRRLGLCGDWLIGPRVEAAWLSGTALAERIG